MKLQNLNQQYKPAPGTSEARSQTDWTKMTNKALAYALNKLELHHSPFVGDVLQEIQRRAAAGCWIDIEQPPSPTHNMPVWLSKLLSRSLWRQKD